MSVDLFGRCRGCGWHVSSTGGCVRCPWPIGCAPSIINLPASVSSVPDPTQWYVDGVWLGTKPVADVVFIPSAFSIGGYE